MADKDSGDIDREPLANPPAVRGFSDRLDEFMGWEGDYKDESRARGLVHGAWHTGAGIVTGNPREFERAGEQFDRATRPPTPPRQPSPPRNEPERD